MSKINELSVKDKEEANDPSGIRTRALPPPNPSISGGFPPPLNTPTVPSTVLLPSSAPNRTAIEVRSVDGGAPWLGGVGPHYRPAGQERTSTLIRWAVAALDRVAAGLAADIKEELRARAGLLEYLHPNGCPIHGGCECGRALLREIGEVR